MSSDVGLTLLGTTGLLHDVGVTVLRCRADVLLGTTGLLARATVYMGRTIYLTMS